MTPSATEQTGFALIPMVAKVLAACGFVLMFTVLSWMLNQHQAFGLGTLFGSLAGSLIAGTILLAGYVYGDARRRGMPPGAWTALAVLIPNGLGFVLYFLLRKPLVCICPACGRSVSMDSAFCPSCGRAMARA
jgi:hypothetical protein